ncbi:hypothetical protein [Commensalibacter nepenthis]|uniref:Toxin-antitoxin system HicB family antitoxin n=1 Tax=Commensalibacter nepenthis TaxID=3043872 RepID=A0ABT6QAP2_9PROT|nr:hypothetical protein [Commensalibacter sp. TBRC 10068]MDI2113864.1 hypothetical protein [Commensalibacter sp. TBRC 10068]
MAKQKVDLNNLVNISDSDDHQKEKKVMMTLTVDPQTRTGIKIEAAKLGIQMNELVERLFQEYQEKEK